MRSSACEHPQPSAATAIISDPTRRSLVVVGRYARSFASITAILDVYVRRCTCGAIALTFNVDHANVNTSEALACAKARKKTMRRTGPNRNTGQMSDIDRHHGRSYTQEYRQNPDLQRSEEASTDQLRTRL
jgi:hypothetical protein